MKLFVAMTLAAKPYYWPNTHEISYGNSPPIATRAGWLALGCLPFLLYVMLPVHAYTAGNSQLTITVQTSGDQGEPNCHLDRDVP